MKNKKYFIAFTVLAVCFFMAAGTNAGENFPQKRGLVNDFADIIPATYENQIEQLAKEVLEKTGAAIVIATVPTIGDANYTEYANRLYEHWGIGKKGEDRGVLLFLTLKERKVRIEVGYGLEGIIPDGLAGEILDKYMVPYFKNADFGKGFLAGTYVISQIIAKNAGVELTGSVSFAGRQGSRNKKVGILGLIPFLIFFLLLSRSRTGISPLLFLLLMGGSGGPFSGGGFGGRGSFGGGFGGFGGGFSGGGGAGRGF
jgi:uncharacterized protein